MSHDLEIQPVRNINSSHIQETKKWDAFKDRPQKLATGEMAKYSFFDFLEKLAKVLTYIVTFAMVLGCAALSKGTLLFMTSQIADDVTRPVCQGPDGPHDRYEVSLEPTQKIAWMWTITFVFFVPQVGTFLRSLRILIFKSWKRPGATEVFTIFVTESLQTVGLALLVFQILPSLDVIKGAMLTNAVCLIPGILCLASRYKEEDEQKNPNSNKSRNITLDVLSIVSQATALIIWPVLYSTKIDNWTHVYLIPVSVVLISFGWWENYVSDDSAFPFIRNLARPIKTFENGRYLTYLFVSIWKCALFLGFMFISPPDGVDRNAMFYDFGSAFADHRLNTTPTGLQLQDAYGLTPVWIFLINIGASHLCYAFAKFACKIQIHRFSYVFPTNLAMPVTVTVLIIMGVMYVQNPCAYYGHIPVHLFYDVPQEGFLELLTEHHVWVWLLWVLSQIWITIHIWTPTSEKLATTERLFVRPMYDPFLIDQHIALNRRRNDKAKSKSHDFNQIKLERASRIHPDTVPRIYVCGTMWHEVKDEMKQFLKSIVRLDQDQSARRKAMEGAKHNISGYYKLETHIFFDDAFVRATQDDPHPQINSYVKDLIQAVNEVHEAVAPPEKYQTPYGGRLVWTLPGETQMIAHLKDKKRIRAKKRWSIVMYMYYLLGHKLMDSDLKVHEKELRAKNTYILALDGDVDFEPKAMHSLVGLMKKNENLGAACGRIHPVGFGPLVWYQMFEYSISHWLQKATEHIIGCVLCSPGCFSLFRAKALMDDGIMGKYTSKSTKAMQCIQQDQGEDGWLCILLLKRGFRVEYSAASDSYTQCPEGFAEFYHQRRRWILATVANIYDFISTSGQTRQVNDDVSLLYVLYQSVLTIGTVLGPGVIFLMLIRAFVAIFNLDLWLSLVLNLIPVLIFILVCTFSSNNKHQILTAGILSGGYALVMVAALVELLLQIPTYGLLAPSTLFFLSITAQMVLAALLHPRETNRVLCGFVYYVAIPNMFMLIIIYAVFNLNNISWGTREVTVAKQTTLAASSKEKSQPKSFFNGGKVDVSTRGFMCSIKCSCCNGRDNEEEIQGRQLRDENIPETSSAATDVTKQPTVEMAGGIDAQVTPEMDAAEEIEGKTWVYDPVLQESKDGSISDKEEIFFKELIEKYLNPDDIGDKTRVQEDLKNLRDKIILIFFAFNATFITVFFLLTLARDQVHIKWPWAAIISFTYVDATQEVVVHKEYLQLEAIGMLFLFGFTLLLLQTLAMLKHRIRTFSQVMSNTSIGLPCFNSSSSKRNLTHEERQKNKPEPAIQQLPKEGANDDNDVEVEPTKIQPEKRITAHDLERDVENINGTKGYNGRIPNVENGPIVILNGAPTNPSYT